MCLREKIGPDPRNFNQRVSLGRNDLLIRTFPNIRMSLSLRSPAKRNAGKILMIKNQQPCPIVDENERSLRFEYRFRRYGIIVLSLIILTALSGLWSSGYFSEAHRETSGGELSVDYQRYAGADE